MSLEAIIAQYERNEKPAFTAKADLKNYFTTFLDPKENNKSKVIRILPATEGSPFVEVYGHSVQVDGQWKKFMCPAKEKGLPCPFCEAREALLATGKESDKELAKMYSTKKMYIVKVIDREHEEDGAKFWRFNHDYRKAGIFDKIADIVKQGVGDFTHAVTGRDLVVNIARDQSKRPTVTSILPKMDITPISSDEAKAAEFLGDDRTWNDVFSIKPYEYLAIIVQGGTPHFDKDKGIFIDKRLMESAGDSSENFDSELKMSGNANAAIPTPAETAPPVADVASSNAANEDDDDLPF